MSRAVATVCLVLVSLLGCDVSTSRQAAVVGAIVEGDLAFSRSRPALLEGKYARMARDVYAYYRGSLAVYRADVRDPSTGIGTTRFRADGVLPLSLGDPHPENFGLLQGPDRTLALEPNDFDAADRYPYTWDLRRLTVGMVLAVRASNQGDEDARSRAVAASALVVDSTVRGYADALHELAAGAAPARVDTDLGQTVLTDLFRRGFRDAAARAELGALTVLEDDGVRRFRLGVLDPAEPEHALRALPAGVAASIPALLMAYRDGLQRAPGPRELEVLDAVREFGSGVASWPRVRVLVLVRGPTDDPADDEVLQIKEELESGADGWLPPGTYYDDPAARILATTRAAWASPDAEPWWGAHPSWLGWPVEIRREAEAHKTVRVARLVGERGTPEALLELGATLGALLARVHASPGPRSGSPAAVIDAVLERDRAGFIDDEVNAALAYARRVEADWSLFRAALRRLGPTLGVPSDAADRPSADVRALFGTPEPVQPWE